MTCQKFHEASHGMERCPQCQRYLAVIWTVRHGHGMPTTHAVVDAALLQPEGPETVAISNHAHR